MMKKQLIAIILVLLCPVLLQAKQDVPSIKVNGTAVRKAVPDELRWRLTIKSVDNSVPVVSQKHAEEVGATLKALEELGQKSEDVLTTGMQLRENMIFRNNTRVREGYLALTTVTFTQNRIEDYLAYWLRLAELTNLTIERVDFAVSNHKEIVDELRIEALLDARQKAEKLVQAVGGQLEEPLVIEEVPNGIQVKAMGNAMAESYRNGGGTPPVSPGTIEIEARIAAVFRMSNS
ncbi:SIMPL domain-containing protein [Desulforhopalus singaporensis]|uniref:Uncharacterized conserved protein YggE, contains kinase-interacting SIMPL domain n=1 Tax=Desulforhopalus singaporensis TaxID=91360 RepID=A0A1H0TLR5_9BACT|nr:SIMPL domain-containing protein [Desulforhopalus singaporensis]SDP54974.1 Uncharacterized conserved protein YggE, contains kinase-interacting SIMPL domain [Desulforhopalus singaporensis]